VGARLAARPVSLVVGLGADYARERHPLQERIQAARGSTWSRHPRREWLVRTPAGSATPSRWVVPVR
jgi:hypothetical protein